MKRKLQIFVSSTYDDLVEDRQAAVSAILKSGHIPAGMELFTAGDKSQMETIKKWIDESDVYMLILGGRYGSIEASSGVSYTELEYDYAVEQGKAFFAVVIKDHALEERVKTHGSKILENENPKQLKMFREKVLSNISSFFEDAKDIKLCVHESLSDYSSSRELKGWVSADEVTQVQPLLDEISKLNKENNNLKEKLLKEEKKTRNSTKGKISNNELEELANLLKSIDIKIPEKLSKDGTYLEDNLLNILLMTKEQIITGITNQMGASTVESFLYHNICPKLQIHGIVFNEKVPSVRWRRFSMEKLGIDLLAHIQKRASKTKS